MLHQIYPSGMEEFHHLARVARIRLGFFPRDHTGREYFGATGMMGGI
jgi:hypothetical protein